MRMKPLPLVLLLLAGCERDQEPPSPIRMTHVATEFINGVGVFRFSDVTDSRTGKRFLVVSHDRGVAIIANETIK